MIYFCKLEGVSIVNKFRELATTYELVENEEGLLKIAYSDGTFLFDDWLDKETLLEEYLAQVLRIERLNYTNIFHDKYYKTKGH